LGRDLEEVSFFDLSYNTRFEAASRTTSTDLRMLTQSEFVDKVEEPLSIEVSQGG
jgi:hypothetical protein